MKVFLTLLLVGGRQCSLYSSKLSHDYHKRVTISCVAYVKLFCKAKKIQESSLSSIANIHNRQTLHFANAFWQLYVSDLVNIIIAKQFKPENSQKPSFHDITVR